jgi:very-short-patch-repair endonuclease
MEGPLLGRLAELARGQDGVTEREQLLVLGAAEALIAGWLQRGYLHRIHAGVYAVGHTALSRRGRLRAASLIAPDIGLSHGAAGEWWAIVSQRSGPVHVTCPRRIDRPRLVAHRRRLPADELEVEDEVLVTSVSRTLLDLAAAEGADAMTGALRKAEFRRLTDPVGLPRLLERYPRGRGTAVARKVLEDKLYLLAPESWLEDVFLPFLRDRRLPMPLVNPTMEIPGVGRIRPDLLWTEARLIVELDGKVAHEGDLTFESDRERDAELLALGYRVMRITYRQFMRDRRGVERRLRQALAIAPGKPAA